MWNMMWIRLISADDVLCCLRSWPNSSTMARPTIKSTVGLLTWLTHWGQVTHICVSDLTIIGSDNGLSRGRRQAIIRTNAGILLIRPLGTNFSKILFEIIIFSFKKMHLKMPFAKRRPFCLGLNVLTHWALNKMAIILQMTFSNVCFEWNFGLN